MYSFFVVFFEYDEKGKNEAKSLVSLFFASK